ncbi:chemotaxis protein CheD [Ferviditalea candida]|uniref:Probable chemoreceptor glutamine deamidase CheD n=1 Tax=Ferviditalea candida TaxID=3108399 RepID=A0ABU5ZF67_9BACL|nr:chemotaxis protein CheD [Paenibacillaceae bacterium T2]
MIPALCLKVGMADLKVTSNKDAVLKTTGLGSCVGVTLYDPDSQIAGMAHIMLPHSDIARSGQVNIAKYADTALPEMIRLMTLQGAVVSRMKAKLAGGAQMFSFLGQNDTMRIGPRNVDSCKDVLKRYSIPIVAEDTGGNFGRTIELYNTTGVLLIRSVQNGIKEL